MMPGAGATTSTSSRTADRLWLPQQPIDVMTQAQCWGLGGLQANIEEQVVADVSLGAKRENGGMSM